MRISGGRYRVTGAHRVVWRWMNKFSPASLFTVPSNHATAPQNPLQLNGNEGTVDGQDFDFGDLVTMTVVDVFETDASGRLLSYCPTFDNRAVHKTQEVTERLLKGASQLKERTRILVQSPASKTVNKAAGSLGKMSLSAAKAMGNIVKTKIEEEIHKHQHPEQHREESISDVESDDHLEGNETARGRNEQSHAMLGGTDGEKVVSSKEQGYLSDGGSPSRRMEV